MLLIPCLKINYKKTNEQLKMSGYFKVSYEDADESEVFGTYEEAMVYLNKVAEKGFYKWVQICDEEWEILYEWVKPRKSKKNKK